MACVEDIAANTVTVISVMNAKLNCLISIIILVASVASAQTAKLIPFQGQLADQSGQPISPSERLTIVFRLYRSAVGGVAIWEEVQPNVSVNGGRFSVLLGSRTQLPPPVEFSSTVYLGLTVDDGNPGYSRCRDAPPSGACAGLACPRCRARACSRPGHRE